MPVFHTKTIESILDPVAQQVSKLVILHEEAEDGIPMPDLQQPVRSVSNAVSNLVKVGRETINSSDDLILRQDMPAALVRVEKSSKLLEEASEMLKQDPFSSPARKRLIEGSGGILQATSSLLLCFDESEVRKIVRECHRVLDYLAVAEVIETLDELVQFLRDLSPCLARVSRDVSAREKELTHQVHSEILIRCLEQVKTLAPILICSMKIYIHIVSQGGKGAEEAAENRNYLAQRMTDEINEIIRVLQLTSYDEEQSDLDNLTVLKKLQNAIANKMNTANDWLFDSNAVRGGVGEKSLRQIIDAARKVADRCLPHDANIINKLCSDLTTMTDALCELRQDGKGATPQAESLAKGIREKLGHLQQAVMNAVVAVDKAGLQQTAHTVQGRLEQARKWLSNPGHDDKGLGQRAINAIVEEGRRVADGLPGVQKAEILQLCDEVDALTHQLADLCAQGKGNTPQAQEVARKLSQKLHELKEKINQAVVNRVVEDFIDIVTPLKQFTEAVLAPEGTPNRDQNFLDKAANLQQFSKRAVKTAKMVAAGGSSGNKKLAEALQSAANQVESLTPQLVSAGSIRMNYPTSKAADEHFENLRQQYADTLAKVRNLCDEATDSSDFIKASEEQMKKHTFLCEEAIKNKQPQKMVDNTSAIARLANRVLSVAKQESDNSEDPHFIDGVNRAFNSLQSSVPPMVQDAKAVAVDPTDHGAISKWRDSNKALLQAVGQVRQAIQVNPELPPLPDMNSLNLVGEPLRNTPTPGGEYSTLSPTHHQQGRISPLPKWARDQAPPRPPLPHDGAPLRPPPPETDDEDEVFKAPPLPSQPIMPNTRLPAAPSASTKSKSRSIYTKSMPSKVKLKLKGGTAVDPYSGLEDVAHVYQDGKEKYTTILGLTDIQSGKNSYYKLQILEADGRNRYWLFRSWGRIGTTIGGNKTEDMSSLHDAKSQFKTLYAEKSGNMWENRDHFVKVPGKMYPIDVDYGEEESQQFKIEESESKLHPSVQDLIRMIFDVNSMKKLMLEFELDTEKLPLGKLSKSQIQKAFGVLSELQQLISTKAATSKFVDASNRFYTFIPHSFGVDDPPLLDDPEVIKQKVDMLGSLMELEIAYNLMKSSGSEHTVDTYYKQLNTEIGVLDRDSEEFFIIQEYVTNTHAKTHTNYELVVEEIYTVKRQGEDKRFKPFKKLHNRKLLWHGSRVTNFAGILSQGLRIAPPEAPVTGYMFGKGIYFADMVSKSANYCATSPGNPKGLMLLCDVALGNMYENLHAKYIDKLPPGKHSCKGMGKTHPDPTAIKKIDDIEVPVGKGVPVPEANKSSLLYNEYIVYDVAQVNVRYLLKMHFKFKGY